MAVLDQKSEVAASRAYGAGKNELPPVALPPQANSNRLFFTRENWPDLGSSVGVVEVRQMVSRDGGASWVQEGGAVLPGKHIDRFGNQSTEFSFNPGPIANPDNASILVKIEIEPLGQVASLRTAVSVRPELLSLAPILVDKLG